ncbi:hypothetical protein [Pseudomonas soli]|uniref:Phage tail protein n=1 Tax=Pseudomonas soli TaxID=1306993 RepID=A0A2V4I4I7_9PSED|nr:hypothetical protein [Pseudomonas soli]PYB84125.1 hypothetical protein DMX07_06155 [Pseudomonas soli]
MDYPKRIPNVGLVGGKFVDENVSTGLPGSLIPSAWGNAVTDELLAVIKAAGLVPSEDNNAQLLQAIQGLAASDIKRAVRVATTGPIALSGLQTIDGVALVAGDRVLVKDQANAAQNWIYTASANAWSRALDANEDAECTPGHLIIVQAGTAYAGTMWQLANTMPPQVGTTALTFAMTSGRTGVAAGTYRQVTTDAFGRVTAGANPTTLAGFGILDAYTKSWIDANKASLASPAFSGTPTAETANLGTRTSQLANCLFVANTVDKAIASLVGSAPAALDTIYEIAAMFGNDPNFATTLINQVAGKADKGATLAAYGILDAYTKTQGQALEAMVYDPWATMPIGVPIPIFDSSASVPIPPTDRAYRYIKLTAGDPYNNGVLTNEVVSGTAPLLVSFASVALAGSPMNTHTVYLINTERRVLRGGQSGIVEQDQFQGHTLPAATGNGANGPSFDSWGASAMNATKTALVSDGVNGTPRVGLETRAKNIGVTYYMRIK